MLGQPAELLSTLVQACSFVRLAIHVTPFTIRIIHSILLPTTIGSLYEPESISLGGAAKAPHGRFDLT